METDRKMYDRQKQFFLEAYNTQRIGWPRFGASRLVPLLLDAADLPEGGRVLEVGSGEGRNLEPFLDRGWSVVAMDLVRTPLLEVRRRTKERAGSKPSLLQGDVFSLPFRAGIFDVIFDFGVFHHLRLPERRAYSGWLSRILRPGGIVGLGVFSEFFRHFEGERRRRNFVTHRGHHDVFFREKDLPMLLGKDFSLVVSDTESPGPLDHYRIAVYRWSGNPD